MLRPGLVPRRFVLRGPEYKKSNGDIIKPAQVNQTSSAVLKMAKEPFSRRENHSPMVFRESPTDDSLFKKTTKRIECWSERILDNRYFERAILLTILIAAAEIGLITNEQLAAMPIFGIIETIVAIVFTFEVVLKISRYLTRPWLFCINSFDPVNINFSNIFDLIVVIACYLNIQAMTVVRLFRLLRILKLVRAIRTLRMIISGLLASMSSIVYVFFLLLLLFYVYAVVGVSLYSDRGARITHNRMVF